VFGKRLPGRKGAVSSPRRVCDCLAFERCGEDTAPCHLLFGVFPDNSIRILSGIAVYFRGGIAGAIGLHSPGGRFGKLGFPGGGGSFGATGSFTGFSGAFTGFSGVFTGFSGAGFVFLSSAAQAQVPKPMTRIATTIFLNIDFIVHSFCFGF